jgi:hypothetical protein
MRTERRASRAILATLALTVASAAGAAGAQEIGIEGLAGNLQFPWDQTTPTTTAIFPDTNYFWGGEAYITAPLGDDASVRVAYERDPIIRNSAVAAVQFERGIAKIAVGPLFGFLNSDATPFSAGISASVRLQWPGVAYVAMRSDGGTAISLLQSSSDPQARTEVSAGFYMPNVVVSGLVSASRFNDSDADGKQVTDSLTRYAMTFDVFKKNVPYTALFSLGYELRSKYYAATTVTDSLGAIVLGADLSAQLGKALKLKGGISTGAYVFGLEALQARGPDSSSFLFAANFGLALDIAALKRSREALPKADDTQAQGDATKGEAAAAKPAVKEEPKEEKPKEQVAAEDAKVKAPREKPKLSSSAGAGLLYDAYPLSGTILDVLIALTYLRGGAWIDFSFPLADGLALGPELGLYYMSASDSTGSATTSLFDIPINAKIGYQLGKLKVEGFGGLMTTVGAATGATPAFGFGLDTGARLWLGGLYLEGSYVFGLGGAQSFPRYGLGYAIKLIK